LIIIKIFINLDNGSKEIIYRVELPYMEELTLVYLEKEADEDDNQQLCKTFSCYLISFLTKHT
jgi:hypothetical protein